MKDVIYVVIDEKEKAGKKKLFIKNYTVACLDTGNIVKSMMTKVKMQSLINELEYEHVGFVVVNKYAGQLKFRLKDNPNVKSGKVKIMNFYDFHGLRNLQELELNEFIATANCIERKYYYDTDYIHSSRDFATFSMWYYSKGKYGDYILDDVIERTLTHISTGLRDDITCLEQNKGRHRIFKNMLYLLHKSKNLTLAQEVRESLEDNPKNNALFCIYLKDYLLRMNDTYIPFKRISNVIPDLNDEDVVKFNTLFNVDEYKTKRELEEDIYTKELLCSLYQDYKEQQRIAYQMNQIVYSDRHYKKKLSSIMDE